MFSSSSGPVLTENARRPDSGGTLGSKVDVKANFFALKKLQVDTLWHYDVSITPLLEDKTKIRRLWKLIERIPELAKHKVVFDGKCNAYAAQELSFDKLTRKIDLPDADPSQSTPRPPNAIPGAPKSDSGVAKPVTGGAKSVPGRDQRRNEFTVKFSRVAVIELEELHRFLRREGPITRSCYQAIQAFNIVLTHKLSGTMELQGRSVYHSTGAQDLGGGVQRWNGAFQSVRAGQDKLYANIDIASTAFYKAGKVEHLMVDLMARNARTPADLNRLSPTDLRRFNRHFKGLPFTVSHRGPDFKRRVRKISEISMKRAEDITFDQELNDGSKKAITIPQYYDAAYSLRLRYPFLPCIGVKGKDSKMIYYPAEVCEVVPGRRYQKKLGPDQTAQMIRGTTLRPSDRAKRIEQLFPLLDHDRDEYLKSFKLEVSKDMEVIPARILSAPEIGFGGRSEKPFQGSWKLGKLYKGATLSSYGILVLDHESSLAEAQVRNFVRVLTQTLVEKGMSVPINDPPIMYGQAGNIEGSVNTMRSLITTHCRKPPQLILVILPGDGGVYPNLKTYCETTGAGIMTQCVLSEKATQDNFKMKAYCGMLTLKINSKLGGCNSVLKNGSKFMTEQPTIIFGADVTHPARGEDRPSIVAVVASMDIFGFQFSGRIKVQEGGQEVIDGLKDLVLQLLLAFERQVKSLPARILFYRDGVSEGQYADILDKEFKAVKEACHQINENYDPPTTFCVVKKRHHARFFPTAKNSPGQQQQAGSEQQYSPSFQQGRPSYQQGRPPYQQGRPPYQQGRPHYQQGRPPYQQSRPPFQQGRPPIQQGHSQQNDATVDRSGNCVAGTIVDTVITHPTEFDFYLQSHGGIQGTSRPTLYHILLDENKFSSDGFQELTYQLCHTYSRCPKSVSIVPAVYYAHLLAYRARYYQGNELSDSASSSSGSGPTFQTSSGILDNMYFV
ncbi:eukaryotic translation initiation factor 2C [Entomortierella parvispora]|uniref:Eukaryotic translation initiation factor 2C n=1 Tax=Entomortierella parvispora TaxID=205924 RepID=A0A9P3H4G9_9FUNG|nr:eukaryotic translation initiation factor 2C [Entomortierella parvispora]